MSDTNLPEVRQGPRIVWAPLPGSQTLAMSCPAKVITYHGTRGPGKTDAQLMRYRMRVGQGYGRFWRGVIFDREYKNLDDLVSKSMRWFPEFDDGAKFKSSKADYRWVWPTGEELLFRAARRESDYWAYHGQEFPYIGWNELTKYPNSNLFDLMMSCNRSSFLPQENAWQDEDTDEWIVPPEIPLEIFATCNPFGVGHNWVKKKLISIAPMGVIVTKVVNVFNPRTQRKEDISKTQCHLFGSYRENKYLSPDYIAELELMTDPNKRKAWLMGDWDVMSGGMFDDVWDKEIHFIPRFDIPYSWKIDRSYDHGSSKPFSVGWWAESDGTDAILKDGRRLSTIKGDLFRIAEWYGTTGKPNTGLRMLANDIAKGIIEREIAWGLYGKVKAGPADSAIWDENEGKSVAKTMLEPFVINGKKYKGVMWLPANKSPGSRKHGWEECRKYLGQAKQIKVEVNGRVLYSEREKPGMFAFENCGFFEELFPILPRDEDDQDDVDTESEDHIGDEVRYKVLQVSAAREINMGSAR